MGRVMGYGICFIRGGEGMVIGIGIGIFCILGGDFIGIGICWILGGDGIWMGIIKGWIDGGFGMGIG